ncbi:hypothetical protein ABBQ38_005538 [Trebouxia sp. C0009 RCD-2024]
MLEDSISPQRQTSWRLLSAVILSLTVGAAAVYLAGQTMVLNGTLASFLRILVAPVVSWVQKGLPDSVYKVSGGLLAAASKADGQLYVMWTHVEEHWMLVEHTLGLDTWTHPSRDAFIGILFSVFYIIWRHHRVIRHQGVPKLWGLLTDNLSWPGPLRRRATRTRVFRQCREAACGCLVFAVFILLLQNSAAPPSLTSDQWFSTTNVQPQVHRAGRQHSSHVPSDLQLPQGSKQLVVGDSDDAQQLSVLQVIAPASSNSAITKALSRALMLVPSAPVCPAAAKRVLLVEQQQTLVLHPVILPPLLLSLATADIIHHACPPSASKLVIADHTPFTTDHQRTSMIADSMALPLLGVSKVRNAPVAVGVVKGHVNMLPRPCNSTCMCCLVVNLSQPVTPAVSPITPAALPITTKASGSHAYQQAAPGSAHVDTGLQLQKWSWLHTLLMGTTMSALGIIVSGLGIWFKFGLLIGSVGAAVMPAGPPEDHVTSKLEPAGVKAGLALKRTTSSLISTKEFAATSTSPTAPSVQQDRHSLPDSDTIPASYVPDAFAAASDQAAHPPSDAPEPAGVHPPQPVPAPPSPLPETSAQSGPTAQLAAAVESVRVHSSTSPQAPVAPLAQGAAIQPASVQRSPSIARLPNETQGMHPYMHGQHRARCCSQAYGTRCCIPTLAPGSAAEQPVVCHTESGQQYQPNNRGCCGSNRLFQLLVLLQGS